jgi:MoaA/NifB/PqqE/SkfB family radical SAM enzyme
MGVVRLSGGEPFVRSDLSQLVDLTQRVLRPAILHITTNGLRTRRIVELLEDRDPRTRLVLLVSVDAVGERHDQIRGVPRAWGRALATIEAVAPRQRELGVRLMVNQTVVDRLGADEHRRLWQRLEPYGVPVNLVVAYAESATYSEEHEMDAPDGTLATFGELDATAVRRLLQTAYEHLPRLRWPERVARRYYVRGVASRLLDGSAAPNPPCAALGHHLRLLPNGDVPTCQFNSKVVGNLAATPFSELWASSGRHDQRRWVQACSGCWAECEVLPSALFSADLVRACGPGRPLQRTVLVPASRPSS